MLKHILLLTPVYVTIFWAINLNSGVNQNRIPRLLLGKFMMIAAVVYISHLLYFLPAPNLYKYIDPFYQYASLMVFPLYYIYLRLLTVDESFSLAKHLRYIIVPTLLFLLYFIGFAFTPIDDFKVWIFNRNLPTSAFSINYMKIINLLIKITFLAQVILTIIYSQKLIRNHGYKAMQFYSDLHDSSTNKVKLLNNSVIITGISSIILGALGRDFFNNETFGIGIASLVFSTMLFIIGWLGDKQKPLNPSYEEKTIKTTDNNNDLTAVAQQKILTKIVSLFNDQKIYLDNTLTIQDIAQSVGTNRTYVSSIINQNFNQNFCTFVNNYRVEELERVILEHPEYTTQMLAETCGFGSVDSLKRAVCSKTEKTISKFKTEILQNCKKNENQPQQTFHIIKK